MLLDNAISLDVKGVADPISYSSWGFTGVGDRDTEFLTVEWENDLGEEFKVDFFPEHNEEVVIDGEWMHLKAEDGKMEAIRMTFNFANLEEL